jgi:hypothetical protein
VLDAAASRARGGPLATATISGRQRAAALDAAGFAIVRPAPDSQMTL